MLATRNRRSDFSPSKHPSTLPIPAQQHSVSRFSEQGTEVTWSQQEGQAEILNLFLLIPFTLFSPAYMQIPIYAYLLLLQYDKTPLWAFYCMFASASLITL